MSFGCGSLRSSTSIRTLTPSPPFHALAAAGRYFYSITGFAYTGRRVAA